MSDAVETRESPQRQVLRALLWKPSKHKVERITQAVYGERPSNAEFEAACQRLGVGTGPSPLDRYYELIVPVEQAGAAAASAWRTMAMRAWNMRYAGFDAIGAAALLEKVRKEEYPQFLLACANALRWLRESAHENPSIVEETACAFALEEMILKFGSRKVNWPPDLMNAFIRAVTPPKGSRSHLVDRSLRVVGDLVMRPGYADLLDDEARACLPVVRTALAAYTPTKLDRERLAAVNKAIAAGGGGEQTLFHEVDPWAQAANAVMAQLPPEQRSALAEVCWHASTCNTSRVSKDWTAEAIRRVESSDRASMCAALGRIFDAYVEHRGFPNEEETGPRDHAKWQAWHEQWERRNENSYRLHGLACVAGATGDPKLATKLAELVEAAAKCPAQSRAQQLPLASACVRALALPASPNLAVLNRLALRIKWPAARKLIAKVSVEAVSKSGLTPQDAEETTVPDFDLKSGLATIPAGDWWAELDATDAYHPRLTWRKPDGSAAKSAAVIKKTHPQAVESAQRMLKDVEGMLPAQRTRLELLLRDVRKWRFDAWRQRYLEHGLLSPMVRRLIWTIEGRPLLFVGGEAQDVTGKNVELSQSAEVAIWHPVGRPVDEVVAWRRRLEELRIAQPFKQAHREVYLLTDAELNTHTYSNRFAAHIVKSGALIAIGQTRKWTVSLYGEAKLALPQFDLRAEFWSHEASDGGMGMEHSEWGGPRYLATDQVRFYRTGEVEPMRIADVPPLPFSEVMRDVDLFVGIASVGADPNWTDGGNDRYRTYWHDFSFGDLGETAKTRKAVLERLVPRLKIAERCSVTDKFLRVQGSIRAYKIHLGSGNILMEPNDQYLCIVPARGGASPTFEPGERVFLPFEGDTTLSVILSKAMLLAEDAKITDPTIMHQIGRRASAGGQ